MDQIIIFLIIFLILLAAGVGGYFGYTKWWQPKQCVGQDATSNVSTFMWKDGKCIANVCVGGFTGADCSTVVDTSCPANCSDTKCTNKQCTNCRYKINTDGTCSGPDSYDTSCPENCSDTICTDKKCTNCRYKINTDGTCSGPDSYDSCDKTTFNATMKNRIFSFPDGVYKAFDFPASNGCPQRAFKNNLELFDGSVRATYSTQLDNGSLVGHGNPKLGDKAKRLISAQAAYDSVKI